MVPPAVKLRATVPRLDGVDLKAAEHVTRRLLHAGLALPYVVLPSPPPDTPPSIARFLGDAVDPFADLHRALDPASQGTDEVTGRSYGVPQTRAARKRDQIASMVRAVLSVVLADGAPGGTQRGRLLDMCGGCGHVGLVLAALLPGWEVVVVDAKAFSLRVAARRAAAAGLRNVRVLEMDINDLAVDDPFDVAVALHACGEASDVVLEKAMDACAAAVVAPCCVGSVVSAKPRAVPGILAGAGLGSAWDAPRSARFRSELGGDEYRLIARAADYGEDAAKGEDGWRRAAKTMIEADRAAWAEARGYHARLVKMEPLACTPKNDVLVLWPRSWGGSGEAAWAEDEAANEAVAAVIGENGVLRGFDAAQIAVIDRQLRADVCAPSSAGHVAFPASQGGRARRLVHAVADSLGLVHESFGKGPERRVAVRRTADWPFFFTGFLGFGGPCVADVVRVVGDAVPPGHAAQRAALRGDRAPHVTLVSAREVRMLPDEVKRDTGLLVSTARRRLSGTVPQPVGLGRVVDERDSANDVYFAIVEWEAACEMRAELGLPPSDLHVTLGFAKSDVHGVCKDRTTLVQAL